MKRARLALAMALFVAGSSGCGGAGEKPLSKAEYIERGDAICKKAGEKGQKETEKLFVDADGSRAEPSEEQLTTFVEEVIKPNIEGQLSDLRDLPVPEGDEDELDDIYEGVETALAKIEADPELTAGEDSPFEESSALARDYGFKECSKK